MVRVVTQYITLKWNLKRVGKSCDLGQVHNKCTIDHNQHRERTFSQHRERAGRTYQKFKQKTLLDCRGREVQNSKYMVSHVGAKLVLEKVKDF